jgi:hypothetical protein
MPSEAKNRKISKWDLLFWLSLLAFPLLVILLTEFCQRYVPTGGLLLESVVAIAFPTLIVVVIYRIRKARKTRN